MSFWETGRYVPRVPAEFQDVPLRNAQVLEDLPRGVLCPHRPGSLQVRKEVHSEFPQIGRGPAARREVF